MQDFFLEKLKRIQTLQKISQRLHDRGLRKYQIRLKERDHGYWCFYNLTRGKYPGDWKWYFALAEYEKIDPMVVPKIWDDREVMVQKMPYLKDYIKRK